MFQFFCFTTKPLLPCLQGRLIAACVLAPINLVVAGLVARQFGWLEFKIVGASEALQSRLTITMPQTAIHQITTMQATSKNVLFPGHNHSTNHWY